MAVLAAAVFAVGITAREADAANPFVNAGGPYSSVAGGTIHFSASANAGPLVRAVWTFGDGTSAQGMAINKQYATSGAFSVTLTVTNIYGQSFTDVTTATVVPFVSTVSPSTQVIQINANGIITRAAVVAAAQIATYPVLPSACAYGFVQVNGVYYCGSYTGTIQTLWNANQACYYLWLQLGYLPSCAYPFR